MGEHGTWFDYLNRFDFWQNPWVNTAPGSIT
jgi:hypothetical protein